MKRGFAWGIISSVLLISQLFAGQINDEWTIFGPKTFYGVTGTTKTYTRTFTVPIVRPQSFNLTIVNGNTSGGNRVTNATIKLNGVTVVTPSECNFETSNLTKEVTIQSSNTLQVTINGSTGSYIKITCGKHLFPIQPILECVENNGNGTYTAHFGYSNSNSYPVTVPVGLLNMFLPIPINRGQPTVFEPGTQQNVFTVVFNGRPLIWEVRGRIATATNNPALACSSAVDTTCPNLSVTSPVDGLITSAASVQVSGTATDASPVTVTLNGTAVTLDGSGAFSGTINLSEGSNSITVIATDAAGNQTTVTRNITRDSIQPVLTVTEPADSTITNQVNISVSGTVTDASVFTLIVNGSTVPVGTGGAFNAQVALTEGINTITISAIDTVNNQSSITRRVIRDTEAPVVNIQTPADNQITNQQIINISGTVTDLTKIQLTVNGEELILNTDGSFSHNFPIVEGLNTITVIATDAIGNQTTVTRTVRRDTEAPILIVQTPTNNQITNQQTINVSGTVTDSTTVNLTINGNNVPIGTGGTYSYDLTIAEGQNVITVVATDVAGNESRQTIDVRRDTQLPVITLTSPIDSLITNQLTVSISGTVTDSTAIQLTVNGEALVVNTDGTFSYNLPLIEGLNTITIAATDTVGNQTTVIRIVRRDTQAPIVNLSSPADSLVTNQQTVNVIGTVLDSTAIQLTVNGEALTVGAGGAFSTQVTLAEGNNTITIVATDAAGNQTTITRTVTRDTESPIITLISPIDSLITNQSNVTVSGTVANPSGMTLTVNGNPTTIETDGTFSTSVGLNEGLNAITLIATDPANNQTTITRTIRRDTQSPVITITFPIDSLLTNQQILNVTGIISDSSTVNLTINGNTVSIAVDGSFSYNISLNEGINNIAITATDAAGNTADVTRIVMLDFVPPVLTITSPVDGTTTSENTIQVSGTVTDLTDITLTINGTAVSVNTDGSFSTAVLLIAGPNTVTITAVDYLEQATTITRTVTMEGQVLPPDPATVAPPIDQTVVTTVATATEFLYTGPNPIQTGVEPGTIDPVRVAVIRGKVLNRDLTPLSGVKITILNHSEFGSTLSRADGMFDLAVNGGGYLTVDYQKQGYLPIQRQIDAPWQDYVTVDSVVMIQLDQNVTTIDFSDSIEVARGSVVTDQSGTRRATLLFRQGTVATMIKKNYVTQTIHDGCNTKTVEVLADSTVQEIPTMSVRATEYTIGETGPLAMPAKLPPSTAYTYCVELSADEAIAAKADEVVFSKPVSLYLENFLGFSTGTIIPVGYYNRASGLWNPTPNGRIIKIVNIVDSVAQLDLDGDEVAEPEDTLIAEGFDHQELKKLSAIYSAGQSLWRSQVQHFSPWDCNFLRWLINLLRTPLDNANDNKPKDPKPDCGDGSIIGIQDQSLGEIVPISGTPFSLNYFSNRVKAYKEQRRLSIPVSHDTISADIIKMNVKIHIAGQTINYSYSPARNITCNHVWDGKDAYGRAVQGEQPYKVDIEYVYPGFYAMIIKKEWLGIPVFGSQNPDTVVYVASGRGTTSEVRYSVGKIGLYDLSAQQLGGFSLNVQHIYDPNSRTINFGDGGQRSAASAGQSILTMSGTEGSGILMGTIDAEGKIYFSHRFSNQVYCRCTDGTVTIFAGTGVDGYSGDGGLATAAQLSMPAGLAVGSDGAVYIADAYNNCVRKVAPNGIITTVAGTGVDGYNGDWQPATNAQLSYPTDVALGPDGSLFITDTFNGRIRRVDANGIISTIAGTGEWGFNGDNIPATQAMLDYAGGIDVAPDGSVYVADFYNNRIRVIAPDGIISTVAGTGEDNFSGDGGYATSACLCNPTDVAVSSDGTIYICDKWNSRIRFVKTNGIIGTLAGTGGFAADGDGGPAGQASLGLPDGVFVGKDGSVYVCDNYSGGMSSTVFMIPDAPSFIRRIASVFPGASFVDYYLPSEDGSELYRFDATGRHVQTLDALTHLPRLSFTYDNEDRLISIADVDSILTTIERDTLGNPLAIISPYGQRTTLTLDSNGYLKAVKNPAGEVTQFVLTSDGAMTSLVDPKLNTHNFVYDELGRLTFDQDPAGGFKQLDRSEFRKGYEITMTTAEGRQTKYRLENLPSVGMQKIITDESGLTRITTYNEDGTTTSVALDGTISTTVMHPDPRFGMQAPLAITTTKLPSGSSSTIEQKRTITQMSGLTATGITDSVIINGRIYRSIWDGEQKLFTSISPEGRQRFSWVNDKGRVIKDSIPGIEAIYYTYDLKGRIVSISQGGCKASYTYNEKSYLASITDPIQRLSRFEYDSVGRITKQTLPDSNQILYSYDANSNLTSLTPPSKPAHNFDYTKVDLTDKYVPPILGIDSSAGGLADTTTTRYEYNKDKQILKVIRPDGGMIETIYDSVGCSTCGSPVSRPKTILFDRGALDFRYSLFTGNLDTLISPSDTLIYTYDGSLPTSVTSRGEINGFVSVEYDSNYRVRSQSINGGNTIDFSYDNDGLLMQAGSMSIAREPETGRISGTTLGNITTSQSYNSLGELSGYQANYSGSPIFQTSYQRDSLGRIIQINEIVEGISKKKNYAYDVAGRLMKVWRNDTLISTYTYDPNGNRIAHITPTSADSGAYDAQDRMLSYGNAQYIYSKNGELQKKIEGTDTTSYSYDYFGNLITVLMPNGDRIDYIIDGQNRRIGKKLNGQIVKRWIYSGQLSPVAELDSAGNVIARFAGGYMIKDGNTYQFITDNLGSVKLIVDVNTGNVAQRLDYDEYGNVVSDSNPDFQPFAYASGLYETQTKLVRFGARDYFAETGRWTIKDPIGFGGGVSNIYEYVLNNPINGIDRNGKQPFFNPGRNPSEGYLRKQGEAAWKYAGEKGKEALDVLFEYGPLVATIAGAYPLAIVMEGESILMDVIEGDYEDATIGTIFVIWSENTSSRKGKIAISALDLLYGLLPEEEDEEYENQYTNSGSKKCPTDHTKIVKPFNFKK